MSAPIRTNQLNYTIDRSKVFEHYDVFCVSTSEKYFTGSAQLLDTEVFNSSILAVLFEKGNSFWVMTKSGTIALSVLRDSLHETPEGKNITIRTVSANELTDRQLLQLLLNSLGNFESPYLRFNNLTGHLYCVCPAWIKHGRGDKAHSIWQIPCLEFRITEDMCLDFPARTFTSAKLRPKISFGTRKFSEYPRYTLTGKNTLRRQLKDDSLDAFILRQIDNQKSFIPFMSIKSLEDFSRSKMGLATLVLKAFNDSFSSIAHISFAAVNEYESIDYTRIAAKESRIRINQIINSRPVRVVDAIGTEDSKRFCGIICDLLLEKYGIKAKTGQRLSSKFLNIRVIHNADYYDGIEDPHRSYSDVAVQHITFEDFSACAEYAVETVIHELLIKQDIIDRRICLFDWESLDLHQEIAFGLPAVFDGKEKYVFLSVFPDGRFEITEEEFNLFHMHQYQDCVRIFEDAKTNHENVRGIIRLQNGEINIIKDTGLIGIPDIERICHELSTGNTKLRGKSAREELMSSILDIKSFVRVDGRYYLVGTIGEGMRYTLNWATNIRKIESYKGAPLFYKELLPMMNVSFVRNGQLTVVPFPFKYLREYLLMREAET